jgi:Spy/CpxP family protein refolding chaperone
MKIYNVFLVLLVLAFSVSAGSAQDHPPMEGGRPPMDDAPPPDGGRPNLLRELGLSPEQLLQIKQMNAERRPQMESAQRAMREAVRALDEAIYADNVNDETVAARIRDFQAAQAEIARIRFNSELTVRKILTSDQLMKFRELRRKFEEERRDFRDGRRNGDRLPPFQRMNRRNRPTRSVQ